MNARFIDTAYFFYFFYYFFFFLDSKKFTSAEYGVQQCTAQTNEGITSTMFCGPSPTLSCFQPLI